MNFTEHIEELKRLMESFASHHGVGMHKVYTSLIDYMAGYLDITCRPVQGWSFNQSQNEEFAQMSVQVLLATSKGIATKGWIDVFGEFFMSYLGEKGRMGQCFTPESLSELLAKIMSEGVMSHPEHHCGMFGKKHVVSDPACGSGRLILATVTNLQKIKGLKCYAVGEDKDETCVKQTAVNLAMHGYFGEVICHDSLEDPETLRFGYIVNEGLHPFPNGIPTLRYSDNPDEFVGVRIWKERRKND